MPSARNNYIAQVKMAQKALALDDETYRAMLTGITGHNSCTQCTDKQILAVLAELRAKGWKPVYKSAKQQGSGPTVAHDLIPLRNKIAALLADMEYSWPYAEGIITRMYGTGVSLATASRQQLSACVAALHKQQSRRAPSAT